jgi:glycosyltransferase involved in cell wall biosynthesis
MSGSTSRTSNPCVLMVKKMKQGAVRNHRIGPEPARKPTIAGYGPVASKFYYRVEVPLRALQRNGLAHVAELSTGDYHGSFRTLGDIVLVNNNEGCVPLQELANAQARGALVVADEDDSMHCAGEFESSGSAGDHTVRDLDIRLDTFVNRLYDRIDAVRDAVEQGALDQWLKRTFSGSIPGLTTIARAVARAHSRSLAVEWAREYYPQNVNRETIILADVLTVSTPTLARLYAHFNETIRVLPNCVDLTLPCYQPEARGKSHEGIVIGWTGSGGRKRDLSLVAPALATLLDDYDGTNGRPRLRVMIGGDPTHFKGDEAPLSQEDLIKKNAFALLGFGIKSGPTLDDQGAYIPGALRHLPGAQDFRLKLQRLGRQLDRQETGFSTFESDCGRFIYRTATDDVGSVPLMYSDIDIGIVPVVVAGQLNHAKSDVKGLEMAGMGVPCVASPIPAYQEWRGTPGTGAIVLPDNEPASWYQALKELIDDEQLRRRMSRQALAFARTRSIDVWAPRWMEVYREAATRKGLAWGA